MTVGVLAGVRDRYGCGAGDAVVEANNDASCGVSTGTAHASLPVLS